MGTKVTFNAVDHEIVVTLAPTNGVVSLDFKIDVYSDGKEDWLADVNLARHEFPLLAVGGEPLPGGLNLDAVFFIKTPWKIRPYDADHELLITGNVFTTDGSFAVLGRPGRTITARINSTFSAGASSDSGGSSAPTASEVANAVHSDARALTVGKYLAIK